MSGSTGSGKVGSARLKVRDAQELKRRGWLPDEIARAMRVSQPTISRWLRGKTAG